jgi:hypothetical protein
MAVFESQHIWGLRIRDVRDKGCTGVIIDRPPYLCLRAWRPHNSNPATCSAKRLLLGNEVLAVLIPGQLFRGTGLAPVRYGGDYRPKLAFELVHHNL